MTRCAAPRYDAVNLAATAPWRRLVRDGMVAVRVTREYVGHDLLPDSPGWSWTDWLTEAAAAIACPHDTDGDGDCGRPLCPYCGGGR